MNNQRGLYGKYIVRKREGQTDPNADYRVLRIDADPAAEAAWRYYGRCISYKNPELAQDIEDETATGAILKPGWKMPEPPSETCARCGNPINQPFAVHTGEGWYLCWECKDECGHGEYEMIDAWPFVENYATGRDLEAVGFRVV